MFKEKLNKILMRILYIFFAVLVSISLWIFVEMTENREQTGTVPNIEFVWRNEEVLRDRNLLFRVVTEPLTLSFVGSRADINRLLAPNALTVEVDLASVNTTGTIQLAYEIIYPSGFNSDNVEIRDRSATRITLVIDKLGERSVPVRVSPYTGGTADPETLLADTPVGDPLSIIVRGPDAAVNRINHVRVYILREYLEVTYTDDLPFFLYDENDEPLEFDEETLEMLSFSQDTIRVTVPIREIKDIPLMVELFHGTTTSTANTSWSAEPATIKVIGDPEVLRDFNSIPLGTINMLQYDTLTFTEHFPIILPPNVTNDSGDTDAFVHVEMFGLEILPRSTSNIFLINLSSGYSATAITQSIVITLRGAAEDLGRIDPMNIRVVADLTDMNRGTARIPARIYIDGIDADIDPIGDYFITVSIVVDEDAE